MHTLEGAATSRISVQAPGSQYDILLGPGLLDKAGELARAAGLGSRVVVASDTTVADLYGAQVVESLASAGFQASLSAMPAGEEHKTMASVELFLDAMLDAGIDRSGWVLALGGGVVGDTAGFAASIFMRGVALVQAPTTLLAMADSSVGGKVGVDHARGKNLVGAFKQPQMVLADTGALDTLPPEQISAGMAEVIKAGIIADPELFVLLEAGGTNIDKKEALLRAIEVKRGIVERDPYESGDRALLNLGHTFGHALEIGTGYTRLHGYAVAQGMVIAARLSEKLGYAAPGLEQRISVVLGIWSLPTRWGGDGLDGPDAVDKVYAAMLHDKKRKDGKLRLVLPFSVGETKLVEGVEEAIIREALVELQ